MSTISRLRLLPALVPLVLLGCGGDLPGHGLSGTSTSHPAASGYPGAISGEPLDAAAGTNNDAPSEPGVGDEEQPAIAVELPYQIGQIFEVASDAAAESGAYSPYYVAFDTGDTGRDVVAMLGGEVVAVNDASSKGGFSQDHVGSTNTVSVHQPDGTRTDYLHLRQSSALVSVGDLVEAGEVLAQSGATGYVGGPRIGVRVTRAGVAVPLCFRTASSVCDSAKPGDLMESVNGGP